MKTTTDASGETKSVFLRVLRKSTTNKRGLRRKRKDTRDLSFYGSTQLLNERRLRGLGIRFGDHVVINKDYTTKMSDSTLFCAMYGSFKIRTKDCSRLYAYNGDRVCVLNLDCYAYATRRLKTDLLRRLSDLIDAYHTRNGLYGKGSTYARNFYGKDNVTLKVNRLSCKGCTSVASSLIWYVRFGASGEIVVCLCDVPLGSFSSETVSGWVLFYGEFFTDLGRAISVNHARNSIVRSMTKLTYFTPGRASIIKSCVSIMIIFRRDLCSFMSVGATTKKGIHSFFGKTILRGRSISSIRRDSTLRFDMLSRRDCGIIKLNATGTTYTRTRTIYEKIGGLRRAIRIFLLNSGSQRARSKVQQIVKIGDRLSSTLLNGKGCLLRRFFGIDPGAFLTGLTVNKGGLSCLLLDMT